MPKEIASTLTLRLTVANAETVQALWAEHALATFKGDIMRRPGLD